MPRDQIVLENDMGEEVALPSRYVVCDRCEGKGVHDHPAFSNGITGEEWHEMDEDDRDNYMRGAYDVRCSACNGKRVVLVADEARMNPKQKAMWAAHQEAMRELARDERSERYLMGDY